MLKVKQTHSICSMILVVPPYRYLSDNSTKCEVRLGDQMSRCFQKLETGDLP